MKKTEVNYILSINVHENINFLISQINNINTFVNAEYVIIINANKYMYNEIKKNEFFKSQKNIILNPFYFEKKRYYGTIFKGIYYNLIYALDNFQFDYFITLSSRNFFYQELNNESFSKFKLSNVKLSRNQTTFNDWVHWPLIKILTKFYKHFKKKKLYFSRNAHEGLTFNYNSALKVKDFFEKEIKIRNNLFKAHVCAEEFAIQTILINFNGYYNIGNGIKTQSEISNLSKSKFIYKKERKSN